MESQLHIPFGADEGHMLAYLIRYGPCPVGELSRVFGHKKSTLTGMVSRLEDDGYISRKINPTDKRSFLIDSTEHGEATMAKARPIMREFEERVLASVSKRDYEGFLKVMQAIDEVSGVVVRPEKENARTQMTRSLKDFG